jgi:hypothetical protein
MAGAIVIHMVNREKLRERFLTSLTSTYATIGIKGFLT